MKLSLCIIWQFMCIGLLAQNLEIRNSELSFYLGVAELNINSYSDNENLDFINYVDFYPEYTDFIIVKLGYKFDFLSRMSADIKLVLMDDLVPDNYDISVYYYFKEMFGVGVGSMLNKNYITGFEQYQTQSLADYYLVDENLQQFKSYDLGFYVTPVLRFVGNDWFKVIIRCDLGFASFFKEESTFFHKKKLSNERLKYYYGTKIAFQPYVHPKIELRLQVFRIKEASVGLLLNSNLFYAKKSMNYSRTVQKWTSEDIVKETIKSPKHKYTRFGFGGGIYVNW